MMKWIKELFIHRHRPRFGALEILKYIGPGFLVTIGFIDPGNWATNMAAGSKFGYSLLWFVTLSTVFLIVLQHNAAHLGIATGTCLSEAATRHFKPWVSRAVLSTAMLASVSTVFAELLGTAIGLNLIFHIPIPIGALLAGILTAVMLYTNTYRMVEKWIIGFVSLIGLSYLLELAMVKVEWTKALTGLFTPSVPQGSMFFIMGIVGSVVMPHNLFLHSEVIQSRQWNRGDKQALKKQLKFEFTDTLVSMVAGWAINCSMIVLAASVFFTNGVNVSDLQQAQSTLKPLAGDFQSVVFGLALIFAGFSSSITSAMAGGSIFSGIFNEPYDIKDRHTRMGVGVTLALAVIAVLFASNPYHALIWSQVILSIQLPVTVFTQIRLTSSKKVMGIYKNGRPLNILLLCIAAVLTLFNVLLIADQFMK